MILAAVYIPSNSLPYIFGENHNGQTLNFGSMHIYNFSEDVNSIILQQEKINSKFIEGFYSDDISLITSIVGRNGIGKTSILRAMNNPLDVKHKDLIFIFENNNNEIHIVNESDKNIISDLDSITTNIRFFEVQYYSPLIAYELSQTSSSISQMKYFNDSLEEYYLDSIVRNIFLLNNSLMQTIKEVYPDFPTYDKVLLKVKKHRKTHFRGVYLEANFANPNTGDALKNHLEGELQRLKHSETDVNITQEELESIYKENINYLDRESFSSLFGKLWSLDEYNFISDKDYIHNSDDIIKNFEITVLSYLILGATFPQTGLGGKFDFDKIVNAENFHDRINKFLELYLINEDAVLYEKIKLDFEGIDVDNKDQIIEVINRQKWSKLGGVEYNPIKKRMINDVEMFFKIKDFYNYLLIIIAEKEIAIVDGNIEFDISLDVDFFQEFIIKYKSLLEAFKGIPNSVSILEFIPNKQLSTGEKSIIDFYASLHTYIDNNKDKEHLHYPYYLLLLDEPELGYHPIWKKKFVQAMTKILPVMFSKITPKQYDSDSRKFISTGKENPTIQVIFSTHDPLTLSDIPNDKVIYLNKLSSNDYSFLETETYIKSFGANITDLLADSFFVEDGLIGDFVKEKITETVEWLNQKSNTRKADYFQKLIENIDEPIIQRKLAEMYDEKMKGTITIDVIEKQIQELEALKNRLRNDSHPTK